MWFESSDKIAESADHGVSLLLLSNWLQTSLLFIDYDRITLRMQVPSENSIILDCQARLAQSVEHETLNLRVVGSSPTLGVFSKTDHDDHNKT